jgi:hypothetical protein
MLKELNEIGSFGIVFLVIRGREHWFYCSFICLVLWYCHLDRHYPTFRASRAGKGIGQGASAFIVVLYEYSLMTSVLTI